MLVRLVVILLALVHVDAFSKEPSLELCIAKASANYGIPVILIKSIMLVEGGRVGETTINKDSSYDLGIMQINDNQPWFRVLKKSGFDRELLIHNGCANIWAGSFILASEIYSAKEFWRGVANYHNRREPFHSNYLKKVKKAWETLEDRD